MVGSSTPVSTRRAELPVLGARTRYIVDLRAVALATADLADGIWLHLTWRDHDDSTHESWARAEITDSQAFVEVDSPLA